MNKLVFAFAGLAFTAACGSAEEYQALTAEPVAARAAALTASEGALQFANDWLRDVKNEPARLAQNVYTTSTPELVAMAPGVSASNRTVCGTLMTRLLQTTGLTASSFYNSFPKTTTNGCLVGTGPAPDKIQYGTNSPDAAQYVYKINNCASTGPVKFTQRSTITSIAAGDLLAVSFPERTDISGHVMMVRRPPAVDTTLPAGPSGSTPYAVLVIDSTSTPHGTSTTYPDERPGPNGAANTQGFGTGTFVVYVDATGAIVATRWSPTDPDQFSTTAHPVAVGGVQ